MRQARGAELFGASPRGGGPIRHNEMLFGVPAGVEPLADSFGDEPLGGGGLEAEPSAARSMAMRMTMRPRTKVTAV